MVAKMKTPEEMVEFFKSGKRTIHDWFELTYASYLVLPRSILQSMPLAWQVKFVELLEELEEQFDAIPPKGIYHIQLKNDDGKFISLRRNDPYVDYERGRRVVSNKKGDVIKDFVE